MILNVLIVLAVILRSAVAKIYVTGVQNLYDKQVLTIKFASDGVLGTPSGIVLEIGIDGHPLRANINYTLSNPIIVRNNYYYEGMELALFPMTNRSWTDFSGQVQHVSLLLTSVVFDSAPSVNQLRESATVANIYHTPTILESTSLVDFGYPDISILGTNLIGATSITLYFNTFSMSYPGPYPVMTNELKIPRNYYYSYYYNYYTDGTMILMSIDTGGGVFKLNGGNGVTLAVLVHDLTTTVFTSRPALLPTSAPYSLSPTLSVGIIVFPSTQMVYESILEQKILIRGMNMYPTVIFKFSFHMTEGVDFVIEHITHEDVRLVLLPGRKWPVGPVYITSIQRGSIIDAVNVLIATVLPDPRIHASTEQYHEAQTHLITIHGSGFTSGTGAANVSLIDIDLTPTPAGNYVVRSMTNSSIVLQLVLHAWLPPFTLKQASNNDYVELTVSKLNTGAGWVSVGLMYPTAQVITLGYVVLDMEGATCSDACATAFDGVCDDPRVYQGGACPNTDCTDCGGVEAMMRLGPILPSLSPSPRTTISPSFQPTLLPSALPSVLPTVSPSASPVHSTETVSSFLYLKVFLFGFTACFVMIIIIVFILMKWKKSSDPSNIEMTNYNTVAQADSDSVYSKI